MPEKSVTERALELAASGSYTTIHQIDRRLGAEGYENVHAHLHGRALRDQLRNAMVTDKKAGSTVTALERRGASWNSTDDAVLRSMVGAGAGAIEVARKLGRSTGSVLTRVKRLRIPLE